MKVGILGTGDVGKTLANAFLATGHQVMMGSREAANEKALAWAKEAGAGSTASTGTFADAAKPETTRIITSKHAVNNFMGGDRNASARIRNICSAAFQWSLRDHSAGG